MSQENLINFLVLLCIVIFLLNYFKPNLLLAETTTSGGDTASHNYPAKYMRDYLLPRWNLIGWSPGWFAGIPMFQFYFPFPFLLISLLSYIIPFQISFKLITVLGTFLLPIFTFLSMKLMKFKFPIPIIAAILTLPFLFNEGNSMWGGNIPSTLAGEFSYSFALSIGILFIGLLYADINKFFKWKKVWVLNSILFSIILLSHLYPAIFVFITSSFFLLDRRKVKENLKYLFKTYLLAGLLVSFWLIPLLFKLQYSNAYHYVWNFRDVRKEVFPDILLPFIPLSIISIFLAVKEKNIKVLYIFYALIISGIFYFIAPIIGMTDVRFVPFFQLSMAIISSCIFLESKIRGRLYLLPLFFLLGTIIWVNQNVSYIGSWIYWNYSGFEGKSYWNQYSAIMDYLKSLPPGRVVHEYSNTHDKFGTPRAFESIPFFSGKPVLEGLNIESALNAPYIFVIQAEISKTPTCPIPGLRCGSFNLTSATEHLRLFNVRYVVATTDELKNALRSNPNYKFLKSFGEIEIYELLGKHEYVTLPKYQPVFVNKANWKAVSLEWFKSLSEVPIVFTDESNFSLNNFQDLPKIPVEANCKVESKVMNEEIDINTTCIGKPLLIKMSYFPNWKVEGADKVYLTTPAFMLIYPKSSHVKLYYGNTLSDELGKALTYIGLIIIAFSLLRKSKVSRFL